MILNKQIIDKLKEKSGLAFDKSKDFEYLCEAIYKKTGRTIGVTTMKRLLGYISDDRNTNEYTLNTIAVYLGYPSWGDLCFSIRIDSDWEYEDDTYYLDELPIDATLKVKYLNRDVCFKVVTYKGNNALQVITAKNSSLKEGDILIIDHLKAGEILEAKSVFRGKSLGNYRTNGELKEIVLE
jgi:hypothetical protein